MLVSTFNAEEITLTYTRSHKAPVYLEFPDFGYGPAAALLSLVRNVADVYDWHIVSTGAAAAHVLAELPNAVVHNLDTFHEEMWSQFSDFAPPGALVISVTNPEFAGWAIRRGYRVGVVDTLDWMWEDHDPSLDDAAFYLVQSYFASAPPIGAPRRQHVRPIVDTRLWPAEDPTKPTSGNSLIGFGGMHVPGADDMVAEYVQWFLGATLPLLIDQAKSTSITIAGGRRDLVELVPKEWTTHPAVHVRPRLGQADYAQLARGAEHLLCSPGLGSIYECAAGRLSPLWQPGFNMSMLLQISELTATSYQHIASWPWMREAAECIRGLPEEAGVLHVTERILSTVREADPEGGQLSEHLIRYIESAGRRDPFVIPVDTALPDAVEVFAGHLGSLT